MKREILFGSLIILALIAFELFNFSTTDFALTDLLGGLRFAGLRWATILAVAFCGMDFAGIARLFSPNSPLTRRDRPASSRGEPVEVWYLLGAWFLAATMNAVLTWWGVSLALVSHANLGNEILSRQQLLSAVPVFVAVLVWLIRILLIGTFSMAGDRLFAFAETARGDVRSHSVHPVRVIGEMNDAPAARSPERAPAPPPMPHPGQ